LAALTSWTRFGAAVHYGGRRQGFAAVVYDHPGDVGWRLFVSGVEVGRGPERHEAGMRAALADAARRGKRL
jgi:hypothetical protein